ncbi:MAG TPA: chemotaxis protein CheX [Verrucomicrobiae bacterium]|nr:chemotaxis protein CheX [Verrucomicrobiae bacterium]
MNEGEIQAFVDITVNYFNQIGGEPARVEPPYMRKEGDSPIHDFTGVIGISGSRKGAIYFTATSNLLTNVLEAHGETQISQPMLADMVGEIANTISGNARFYFGHEFMISVPVVLLGRPSDIRLPENIRSFVIPISWHGSKAHLLVCLEN